MFTRRIIIGITLLIIAVVAVCAKSTKAQDIDPRVRQDAACDYLYVKADNYAQNAAQPGWFNTENDARLSQTFSQLYMACIVRYRP